jgi:hypothetical protein
MKAQSHVELIRRPKAVRGPGKDEGVPVVRRLALGSKAGVCELWKAGKN